jgi:hypothetical protein
VQPSQLTSSGDCDQRSLCIFPDKTVQQLIKTLSHALQTHVTSSGTLHIVADEQSLLEALDSLDLPRARLLARLSGFWDRQAR